MRTGARHPSTQQPPHVSACVPMHLPSSVCPALPGALLKQPPPLLDQAHRIAVLGRAQNPGFGDQLHSPLTARGTSQSGVVLPGKQFHFPHHHVGRVLLPMSQSPTCARSKKGSSPSIFACMQNASASTFPATPSTVLSHHLPAGSLVACHDRRASPRLSCRQYPSCRRVRLVGETPHSLVLRPIAILYTSTRLPVRRHH